ncbi:uncharacterized protein DUF4238 [Flavobacterium sp. 270]|uniref:DUF4238 domain-containing protein n=1 Tax=Flavobacterium sp. 270 TaxID=2512114 RepID=UPI0010DF1F37|nr:DUF4238 domain-containing protein [Flavobacterium sp. 270]TDW48052.1 uncharacterized protein DUF4238 [Flavobacterium sp. 270]
MKTNKKNQHYIPKFYLRNFSYNQNKNEIGIFNIFNNVFVQRAKLRHQGSKNFFYGIDGKIEDALANIEGNLADLIKNIISDQTLPKKFSVEHIELLTFVAITDARNPVRIDTMKNHYLQMEKTLKELDPNVNMNNFLPNLTHEEHIKLSLSNTNTITEHIIDLDFKLLVNKTSNTFLTSDFPIVKYNQFLELKKWKHSKSGYSLVGLKIFIPLSPTLTVVFFDSAIYKVGNKKDKIIELSKKEDIDQLNILQYINCFSTIFFNERINNDYINYLKKKSEKYSRANDPRLELSYIVEENDDVNKVLAGKQNLMIFNTTDCETNLNLSFLKIHSNGKHYKLDSRFTQVRKPYKKY